MRTRNTTCQVFCEIVEYDTHHKNLKGGDTMTTKAIPLIFIILLILWLSAGATFSQPIEHSGSESAGSARPGSPFFLLLPFGLIVIAGLWRTHMMWKNLKLSE
jgi:hypothetical protein